MDRVKKLSQAHVGYIENLVKAHGASEEIVKIVSFHYVTAFEHGYKHALEDAIDNNQKAFEPQLKNGCDENCGNCTCNCDYIKTTTEKSKIGNASTLKRTFEKSKSPSNIISE